ncbi:uncharacterized protein LOC115679581 [Syzygium oleosum]|uniref:uncharacterized protein LOC115679581 n=1 Tax=Syzygium oleosum TaxID=219896 RepID=UPI0024BB3C12|nr:uncharacterized protein LOC115679581 [Syzygium oleosum]
MEVILSYESFAGKGNGSYPLAVASMIGNNIRLDSDYILRYSGNVRAELTGILYHESTHVWQWNGNGMAPSGLVTGIADYMRLKAGWPKRGLGLRWDEGYAITVYFLEYCDGLRDGFVADLNAMMKYTYSDSFFVQLLGKMCMNCGMTISRHMRAMHRHRHPLWHRHRHLLLRLHIQHTNGSRIYCIREVRL